MACGFPQGHLGVEPGACGSQTHCQATSSRGVLWEGIGVSIAFPWSPVSEFPPPGSALGAEGPKGEMGLCLLGVSSSRRKTMCTHSKGRE